MTADTIKEALKQVKYPGFSRDIVSFGLVRSAAFVDGTAKVAIALTTSDPKLPVLLKTEIEKCLRAQPGVKDVIIELAVSAAKAPPQTGQASLGGGVRRRHRQSRGGHQHLGSEGAHNAQGRD